MDEVRRQLERLDLRLAGKSAVVSDIITSSPLLLPAVAIILGIILQVSISPDIWLWLFVAVAAFLLGLIFCISVKRFEYKSVMAVSAVFLCALSLGAVRISTFNYAPPDDIRNIVGTERTLAAIRGTILTDPYTKTNSDWAFERFSFSDPSSSFYLKIDQVESVDGWADVVGTVRVQVSEPVIDLKSAIG